MSILTQPSLTCRDEIQAFVLFSHAKESLQDRGFTGAGASHTSDLVSGSDSEVHVFENQVCITAVAHIDILEDYFALGGPDAA